MFLELASQGPHGPKPPPVPALPQYDQQSPEIPVVNRRTQEHIREELSFIKSQLMAPVLPAIIAPPSGVSPQQVTTRMLKIQGDFQEAINAFVQFRERKKAKDKSQQQPPAQSPADASPSQAHVPPRSFSAPLPSALASRHSMPAIAEVDERQKPAEALEILTQKAAQQSQLKESFPPMVADALSAVESEKDAERYHTHFVAMVTESSKYLFRFVDAIRELLPIWLNEAKAMANYRPPPKSESSMGTGAPDVDVQRKAFSRGLDASHKRRVSAPPVVSKVQVKALGADAGKAQPDREKAQLDPEAKLKFQLKRAAKRHQKAEALSMGLTRIIELSLLERVLDVRESLQELYKQIRGQDLDQRMRTRQEVLFFMVTCVMGDFVARAKAQAAGVTLPEGIRPENCITTHEEYYHAFRLVMARVVLVGYSMVPPHFDPAKHPYISPPLEMPDAVKEQASSAALMRRLSVSSPDIMPALSREVSIDSRDSFSGAQVGQSPSASAHSSPLSPLATPTISVSLPVSRPGSFSLLPPSAGISSPSQSSRSLISPTLPVSRSSSFSGSLPSADQAPSSGSSSSPPPSPTRSISPSLAAALLLTPKSGSPEEKATTPRAEPFAARRVEPLSAPPVLTK